MKRETNNEIDLLLRRLSRRHGVSMPGADSGIDVHHLDADELSSYAENALPAVARARYTEHLAECSSCRELVVQLSSSLGVVAAEQTASVPAPSGLKKFLANLISPAVFRYAVPALALIVVATIGFVILRSNRNDSFVAELKRPQQQTPEPAASEQPSTHAHGDTVTTQKETQARAAAPQRRAERSNGNPAPPPNAPPSVTADTKTETAPPKTEPQVFASGAPAQPAPTPSETVDEMRIGLQKLKPDANARSNEAANENKRTENKKSQDVAGRGIGQEGAKALEVRRAPRGIATVQSAEAKDRDSAETRSVAGRRFRKERGVWVDTAYDPASATVNLERGSEQFRALAADEPSIKTIADQLDGQIVVVWKGRAYKIR